jgi:DNA-directed RNA polymerase subunit H (RpoH/RPB5)
MDYETVQVIYKSRQTILKLLAGRNYNTKPYEKFGPVEVTAMIEASKASGSSETGALQMDLKREVAEDVAAAEGAPKPISKCKVVYSFSRIKNSIARFVDKYINSGGEEGVADTKDTELIVILLEPIADTFHTTSLTYLARGCRVSFFNAHNLVYNPLEHMLVPKHELLSQSQHAEFLKMNRIKSKEHLPIIRYHEDIIARILGMVPGDIVKITRPSPSAGEYVTYRVCAP